MNTFVPGLSPHDDPRASVTPMPDVSRLQGYLFFTVNERSRVSIATSIERLIDMLDAMDVNPDDEDGGDDEPYLGWFEAHCGRGHIQSSEFSGRADTVDLELDDSDLEDGGDLEPNLTSPECHIRPWGSGYGIDGCQLAWAEVAPTSRATDECEEVNEDGGDVVDGPHDDNGDDEPSIGWPEQEGQHGVGLGDLEVSDAPCDAIGMLHFDGSGVRAGIDMVRGMPTLRDRVNAITLAGGVSAWLR